MDDLGPFKPNNQSYWTRYVMNDEQIWAGWIVGYMYVMVSTFKIWLVGAYKL